HTTLPKQQTITYEQTRHIDSVQLQASPLFSDHSLLMQMLSPANPPQQQNHHCGFVWQQSKRKSGSTSICESAACMYMSLALSASPATSYAAALFSKNGAAAK